MENGAFVSLLYDRWNSSGMIRPQIYGPLKGGGESPSVSQCWNNNVWDFSHLSVSVPSDLQNLCESVHIPDQRHNLQDLMISDLTSNGNFDFSAALKPMFFFFLT